VTHCGIAGAGALQLLGMHRGAVRRVTVALGAGAVTIGIGVCRLNVTHCGAKLGWLQTSGKVLSSASPESASLLLVATLRDGEPMVLLVTVGSTLSAGGMAVSLGSVAATPWSTCMSLLEHVSLAEGDRYQGRTGAQVEKCCFGDVG